MYMNITGNVITVAVATGEPVYQEAVGEKAVEMTTVPAYTKEATPNGLQGAYLKLAFFGSMAIPAMKIVKGDVLILLGRETVYQFKRKNKQNLERTVTVDAWFPRVLDPLGMFESLRARQTVEANIHANKEMFAQFLTECKPTIIQWVMDEME